MFIVYTARFENIEKREQDWNGDISINKEEVLSAFTIIGIFKDYKKAEECKKQNDYQGYVVISSIDSDL